MSVTASASTRYRLDDLRRLAASLASGLGVAPARSSTLATHLLWFDAAGASSHGVATLPTWLDRLDRGEIDAKAEGSSGLRNMPGPPSSTPRTAWPPLALEKAAGIAAEKARDVGVGIVRVRNLGPSGPPRAGRRIAGDRPFRRRDRRPRPVASPWPYRCPKACPPSMIRAWHSEPEVPVGPWLGAWIPWISATLGRGRLGDPGTWRSRRWNLSRTFTIGSP